MTILPFYYCGGRTNKKTGKRKRMQKLVIHGLVRIFTKLLSKFFFCSIVTEKYAFVNSQLKLKRKRDPLSYSSIMT